MAGPVFYFTFILYLFGEGVAPTKNAGSTLGTVQEKKSFSPSRRRERSTVVFAWAILSTRSRRRAVRRIFARREQKAAPSVEGAGKRQSIKKAERRFNRHSAGIISCYNTSLLLELKCQPKHIRLLSEILHYKIAIYLR